MGTDLHKEEIARIEEVAHELALILNTVKSPAQISRIQRNLESFSNRYKELTGNDLSETILSKSSDSSQVLTKSRFLSKIRIERASPHCEYHEINLISSIVKEFEVNYWSLLSDRHIKLDYSTASERDSYFTKLEEFKRNLKLILENIEEAHRTQSREYLARLRTMRIKQERQILLEFHDFFRSISQFLEKIVLNLDEGSNIVLNSDEMVTYDRHDGKPYFKGKSVAEAVRMIYEFTKESAESIRVPDL